MSSFSHFAQWIGARAARNTLFGPIGGMIGNMNDFLNIVTGKGSGDNVVDSLVNKYSDAGPTGKELWQAQREDTAYQRSVADMQAAGLNPALMYGNSAGGPSASSAGSSMGPGISDLLQLAMLPLNIQATKAQIGATEAQAAKDNAEAARTVQQTSFEKDYQPLLLEARQVGNDLTRAERNQINANLDRIAADIDKIKAETQTEETRQQLNIAESVLRNAEASQIIQLMPYRQALMEAQTDNERAQAALAAVNRMYQQRILNSDYLDNMFSAMRAQASSSESKAALDNLHQRIRTGSLINVDDDASLIAKIGAGIVNYPVAVVANILDNASGVIAAGLGAGAAVKVAGLKNAGKQSAPSGLVLPTHTNEFGNTYGYR